MKAAVEGPDNPAVNLTDGLRAKDDTKSQERAPSFSPDGRQIAFRWFTNPATARQRGSPTVRSTACAPTAAKSETSPTTTPTTPPRSASTSSPTGDPARSEERTTEQPPHARSVPCSAVPNPLIVTPLVVRPDLRDMDQLLSPQVGESSDLRTRPLMRLTLSMCAAMPARLLDCCTCTF